MNWETLMSFGDSITIGSRTYLGYPEKSADILMQETGRSWNVFNIAVAGFTTIQLNRLVSERMTQLRSEQPSICTLMIGTNDAKSGTSEENFKLAYHQLLIKIRLIQKNRHVILIGIPLLEEGVMLPYEIDMNRRIVAFNEIIQSFAEDQGLHFLKFNGASHHYFDGVHLNEAGVEHYGKQLAAYILKLRGKEYEH